MVYGKEDGQPTYWLTRFVILRLLGLVYAVAFLVAIDQIIPLIGSDGLLPVGIYLRRVSGTLGSTGAGFRHLPSLFWLFHSDTALLTVAYIGFILSCIVLAGFANAPIMTILWFLYMSFVHVGQDWYGYGWEIQLLETGFLAIFLCPLLDPRPFPRMPPPIQIIILFRWLIFRIMLGSGMIKLRGDEVWSNRTALYYHFETQPMPGPFSRWFHFLPRWALQFGVLYNWLAELIAPWFVFWPRIGRHIAGCAIVLLQVILILSGNLSFLNWLTIIPALACFDDGWWTRMLPRRLVRMAEQAEQRAVEPGRGAGAVIWTVTVGIALLSVEPAVNILSPQQIMNTSFDPLDLVNTYGAFGSVGRERLNVVFEGADDTTGTWKPYPYKGLPVDPDQRPPQIAPYHLRLDWQMWFAAMATPEEYAWTYHLIWKLLHNDPLALRLFAGNPFPNQPPHYIRAVLYRYSFVRSGQGHWWRREQVGSPWIPPMSTDNPRLREILNVEEWLSGSVGSTTHPTGQPAQPHSPTSDILVDQPTQPHYPTSDILTGQPTGTPYPTNRVIILEKKRWDLFNHHILSLTPILKPLYAICPSPSVYPTIRSIPFHRLRQQQRIQSRKKRSRQIRHPLHLVDAHPQSLPG